MLDLTQIRARTNKRGEVDAPFVPETQTPYPRDGVALAPKDEPMLRKHRNGIPQVVAALFEKPSQRITARSKNDGCGNVDVDGTLHRVAFATNCVQRCASHQSPLDQPCLPCTGRSSHALDNRTTATSCPYPRAQPPSPALISHLISAAATVSAAIPFVF